MTMNDGPLECASCGGSRSATVPWVCGECLVDAAEHASGMLADLSDAGVGELLQDRRLLADVGMPVVPGAMTDAVELDDPREIAVPGSPGTVAVWGARGACSRPGRRAAAHFVVSEGGLEPPRPIKGTSTSS